MRSSFTTVHENRGRGVGVFTNASEFPAADLEFSKDGLHITSKSNNSLDVKLEGSFKDGSIRVNMARLLTCLEAIKCPKIEVSMTEQAMRMRGGDLTVLLGKMFK